MPARRYREILSDLIAIDTTSRHSNLPFLDHVESLLGDVDCQIERMPGESPGKANLWVTIGPADRAGYVLSGHSDTVPVDGQDWTANPFELRSEGSRLYGRGTADMKGFIAVCLAHVPEMAAANLSRPIHLAISCDEEIGCRGVPSLLAEIGKRDPKPLGCFVGEPTNMAVVTGHKGKRAYRTVFHGSYGHSSLAPRHVNAVEWAARLVNEIQRVGGELARRGPQDQRFDIAHSTLLTTTIQGGTALNIVPGSCVLEWECRTIPADEAVGLPERIIDYAQSELLPHMRSAIAEGDIELDEIFAYPPLDTADTHPLVRLAQELAGDGGSRCVAYGTEAGLFDRAGIPSVVIGPGSIEQAHKADEFVDEAQLAACGRFISGLIAKCSH